MLSAKKQAIRIATAVGHFLKWPWPWLCKRLHGLTNLIAAWNNPEHQCHIECFNQGAGNPRTLTAPAACAGEAPKMKEDMRRLIPENMPCEVFSAVHVMEFCTHTCKYHPYWVSRVESHKHNPKHIMQKKHENTEHTKENANSGEHALRSLQCCACDGILHAHMSTTLSQ